MDKITAPYNFVPLNKTVFIPQWGDEISQDIPFSDGEDGIIKLTFKNITPLFIRDGNYTDYSTHIVGPDGKRYYYLPGTSIKGMVRSIMEVLTFSKMDRYDDDFFGYRDFRKDVEYVRAIAGKQSCGWLTLKNEDLFITPCGSPQKIEIETVKKVFPCYDKTLDAQEKHQKLQKETGEKYPSYEGLKLVCTGAMSGKKHEYLFGNSIGEKVKVTETVKEAFFSVYKPSPYYKGMLDSLDKGEEIPVFYLTNDKNKSIACLGLTYMFRYPYTHRISDGVKQTDVQGQEAKGCDMTQCIMGYVKDNKALRGRVQFGNAFSQSPVDDSLLIDEGGVLGQPKASYYPLYLKSGERAYTRYDSPGAIEIAGRKRYRIHTASCKLPQGNGKEKILSSLKLIPIGSEFTLRITVHNLRPTETGALLSSLLFHGFKGAYHNIGMAKGCGFGKLEITSVELENLKETKEEYMGDFERLMSQFTHSCKPSFKWIESEQVKMLFAIACNHTEGTRYMELEEYADSKKVFLQLHEDRPVVTSLIDEKKEKRKFLQPLFDEIEGYISSHNYREALNKCEILYTKLGDDQEPEVVELETRIKDEQKEYARQMEADRAEEEENRRQQRAAQRLTDILEEKTADGMSYKIKELKVLCQRCERRLKDNGRKEFDENEKADILITLRRLYNERNSKNSREWEKGACYENLIKWLGPDFITMI